jgi:3-methyladenine DNA glycosylase AlkD
MHCAQNEYYEEVMLQGMVVGYLKTDIEELLNYVTDFVPKINNWAVCDSFSYFTFRHSFRINQANEKLCAPLMENKWRELA